MFFVYNVHALTVLICLSLWPCNTLFFLQCIFVLHCKRSLILYPRPTPEQRERSQIFRGQSTCLLGVLGLHQDLGFEDERGRDDGLMLFKICCFFENLSAEWRAENVKWLTDKFTKKQQILGEAPRVPLNVESCCDFKLLSSIFNLSR